MLGVLGLLDHALFAVCQDRPGLGPGVVGAGRYFWGRAVVHPPGYPLCVERRFERLVGRTASTRAAGGRVGTASIYLDTSQFTVREVRHSWQELQATSRYLNNLLHREPTSDEDSSLVIGFLSNLDDKLTIVDAERAATDLSKVEGIAYFEWDMESSTIRAAFTSDAFRAHGPMPDSASVLGIVPVEASIGSGSAVPFPCTADHCSPMRGGVRVQNTQSCTIGGAGVVVGGSNQVFLSASHCNNANWSRRVLSQIPGTAWSNWFDTYTTTLTGGVVAGEGAYNGSRFDGQGIDAPDREITSVFWFTDTQRDRRYNTTEAFSTLSVNEAVCMSGQFNKDCGIITALGRTFQMNNPIVNRFESQIFASYLQQPGDSGGIVFDFSCCAITGIHSGVVVGGAFDGDAVFSSISYIGDAALSIHVEDDPVDDFVNGLYDRVVNRDPDTGGFDYWRNTGIGSSCTLTEYRTALNSFLIGAELKAQLPLSSYANTLIRVEKAYLAALSRPSDSSRISWADMIWNSGSTPGAREAMWDNVAYSIVVSTESSNRYSNGTTIEVRPCH